MCHKNNIVQMCNPGSWMGSTDLRRNEAPPSSATGKPGALQVIWGKLPVAGLCCLTPVLLFAPFFFFFTLGHSGPSHQLCSKHLQTLLQTQKVRGTVPPWSHKLSPPADSIHWPSASELLPSCFRGHSTGSHSHPMGNIRATSGPPAYRYSHRRAHLDISRQ